MSTGKIHGPVFFRDDTVTRMLPKLHKVEPQDFIWQQDGAPHFRRDARRWLNNALTHRWIRQGGPGDLYFLTADCTVPCHYFLCGYVKDKVFVPLLPASIPDLQSRSTATVETITPDKLIILWQELDYSLDVCRVTKGDTSNTCMKCVINSWSYSFTSTTKLRGRSPQANYTDRATAASWRS
jgi:hypothetical protein